MAKDYEPILLRTIDAIERNTWDNRQAVYQKARRALRRLALPADELKEELGALEEAIARVESGSPAAEFPHAATERNAGLSPGSAGAEAGQWSETWRRKPLLLVSCLAGAAIAATVATYVLCPAGTDKGDRIAARDPPATPAASSPDVHVEKPLLESAPYVLGRQLVYYRTTYPPGTVVISKSQRFLYLVRPNVVAVRYAMGLGNACAKAVGLLLVSSKEDAADDAVRQSANATAPRREFGRHSLALGDTGYRIHGGAEATNARAATVGCFPLRDDDVSDLYDRVAVGARVVIN